MPEGPEVKITSDGIRSEILGYELIGIEINSSTRYYKNGLKNLEDLDYPIKIDKVYSKGKKILIKGKDKRYNTITFISALAMEGSWKLYPGKHSGIELYFRLLNPALAPLLNPALAPSESQEPYNQYKVEYKVLYFHDTRHFGSFDICLNKEEEDFVMKFVGPDLLNEDVSFEQYQSIISKENLKEKEICWFMMEQKFLSGVGNYLLAEILYACKILPTRLLKNLSETDKYNLWFFSCKLLKDSYEAGGLTISTYFSMNGEKGIFDNKVYMREKDPLGNPVITGTFTNKRTSHYVPAIQK